MSRNILIAGGSGMVGTALVNFFRQKNDRVWILSTQKNIKLPNTLYWNPKEGKFPNIDFHIDILINLAGANIGDSYWTPKRKIELEESRICSAKLISQKINENEIKVTHFIQFTAIGYYGSDGENWKDEHSAKGSGFLADLVEKWEAAAQISHPDTLQTILRLGVVLDSQRGALKKMTKSIHFGINIVFGNGLNYLSTIALNEIPPIVNTIINTQKTGVINLVDNAPITQIQLLKNYAKQIGKNPITIKIPEKWLKALLGDFSQIMLNSQRVRSVYLPLIKKES